MQLQLFDPSRCHEYGEAYQDLLLTEILPGLESVQKAERRAIGALSTALKIAGDNREHPDFQYLCRSLHQHGFPINDKVALIGAYRYATDPKTASTVAHMRDLRQVNGYICAQMSIDDEPLKLAAAASPNKLAAPLDFSDLSKGSTVSPHVSGKIGEDGVLAILKRLGIQHETQFPAPFIGWGKKQQSIVDFKLAPFDATPLERGCYVEVKWRSRDVGSCDDDLTALLHNIEAWYDLPVIVVYDGEGANPDTYENVKKQMENKRRKLSEKLLAVMTLSEFASFATRQLGKQEGR